jgi:hypothetical protein
MTLGRVGHGNGSHDVAVTDVFVGGVNAFVTPQVVRAPSVRAHHFPMAPKPGLFVRGAGGGAVRHR